MGLHSVAQLGTAFFGCGDRFETGCCQTWGRNLCTASSWLLILVQMGVDAYDLGSVDGSGYDSGFPGGDGSALREHLPQNAGQSEERGLPTSPRSPTARQVAFAEGDWAPLQSIRSDLHPKHFTNDPRRRLAGKMISVKFWC